MARRFLLPASIDANYARLTVAGATFLFCIEFIYFMLSDTPSFYMPSLDALGQTAIGRDFLNTWMGGRSAFAGGPAAWFDAPVYNKFLREFMGVPYVHDYFWSYPPHILLFVWPFGLLPYFLSFRAVDLARVRYLSLCCRVRRRGAQSTCSSSPSRQPSPSMSSSVRTGSLRPPC